MEIFVSELKNRFYGGQPSHEEEIDRRTKTELKNAFEDRNWPLILTILSDHGTILLDQISGWEGVSDPESPFDFGLLLRATHKSAHPKADALFLELLENRRTSQLDPRYFENILNVDQWMDGEKDPQFVLTEELEGSEEEPGCRASSVEIFMARTIAFLQTDHAENACPLTLHRVKEEWERESKRIYLERALLYGIQNQLIPSPTEPGDLFPAIAPNPQFIFDRFEEILRMGEVKRKSEKENCRMEWCILV